MDYAKRQFALAVAMGHILERALEAFVLRQAKLEAKLAGLPTKQPKEVALHYRPQDRLRLLRLQSWSLAYKVSVAHLLDLTVPSLRTQWKGKKPNSPLGISLRMLVNEGCKRILLEELKKRYPQQEHKLEWKHDEQQLQLNREYWEVQGELSTKRVRADQNVLDFGTMREYVQHYKKKVLRVRQEQRIAQASLRRKRKPYRDNPW